MTSVICDLIDGEIRWCVPYVAAVQPANDGAVMLALAFFAVGLLGFAVLLITRRR